MTIDNYVFTRVIGQGLSPISTKKFDTHYNGNKLHVPGVHYSVLDIGFDLTLGGTTYKKICVSPSGNVALLDGTTYNDDSWLSSVWQSYYELASYMNTPPAGIALLCPWLSGQSTDSFMCNEISELFVSTVEHQNNLRRGYTDYFAYNKIDYGVRSYLDNSTGMKKRIVRWNCFVNGHNTNPSALVGIAGEYKFEVVISENGSIEFRYAPFIERQWYSHASASEGYASVCIVTNDSLRDMSQGLGYDESGRLVSQLGGFLNSSWFDPGAGGSATTHIAATLSVKKNWPGGNKGCTLQFKNFVEKRKIYPRLESKKQKVIVTGAFDDSTAITLNQSPQVLSYPTTLNRFYGNNDISSRQDLFVSQIEVTGSTSRTASEVFVSSNVPQLSDSAFSEDFRHEQTTNDLFYTRGNKIEYLGVDLSAKLSSKESIRYELLVRRDSVVPPLSACLYYYNSSNSSWLVPPNAVKDIANPIMWVSGTLYSEDARLFDALGNVVSSGSLGRLSGSFAYTPQSSIPTVISKPFVTQPNPDIYGAVLQVDAISGLYDKSVQNNSDYRPSNDDVIRFKGESPFLLEKAVIQVPLIVSSSWFNELTNVDSMLNDVSGPTITFALLRRCIGNKLDLICSGTVTHSNDTSVSLTNPVVSDGRNHIAIGVSGNPNNVSAIIPAMLSSFTGSVTIPCTVATSNGVALMCTFKHWISGAGGEAINTLPQSYVDNAVLDVEKFLSTPKIRAGNYGYFEEDYHNARIDPTVYNVNVFGRSASGFEPSGRSIFGKEHSTSNGILSNDGFVKNNACLPLTSGVISYLNALTSSYFGSNTVAYFTIDSFLSLAANYVCPYLLLPDDELIVSVSKHRPRLSASGSFYVLSGSHEISLNAGSLNLSLYGSYLRQDTPIQKTRNTLTETTSDLIEIDTDVSDSYDVPYNSEIVSTYTDNYVTGSMILGVSGSHSLMTGTRGVAFSKMNASSQPMLGGTEYNGQYNPDSILNPSKAFRMQPWSERSTSSKFLKLKSQTERIYDSMIPSFDTCLAADSTSTSVISSNSNFLFHNNNFLISIAEQSYDGLRWNTNCGFVFFDLPKQLSMISDVIKNRHWLMSFPFEPRYSRSQRISTLDSHSTRYRTTCASLSTGSVIYESAVTSQKNFHFGNLAIVYAGLNRVSGTNNFNVREENNQLLLTWASTASLMSSSVNTYNTFGLNVLADTDLTQMIGPYTRATGSAGFDDATKFLYGFGDSNTVCKAIVGADELFIGSTHVPETRDITRDNYHGLCTSYSPVIRGWKYGLRSGLPVFREAYFRRGSYGNFRDMLEQSIDTKYVSFDNKNTVSDSPVIVKFFTSQGNITDPANTQLVNMSQNATSSVPYFDGEVNDRPVQNTKDMNLSNVILTSNNGNVTV